MTKRISASVDDWIVEQILNPARNQSARIQELIVKGYIEEQKQAIRKEVINSVAASHQTTSLFQNLVGLLSHSLIYNNYKQLEVEI